MTIRQLAETAGCGINTVRRLAKVMFPNVKAKGRGLAIDYDEKQSVAIMEKLPKKNFVFEPEKKKVTQMVTQMGNVKNEGLDYEKIGQMIGVAVTAAVAPMVEKIIANMSKETPLLLSAPEKTDRKALNQLVNKYANEVTGGDRRAAWHVLYEEIYYRLNRSVKVCARNRGVTTIDYIESEGLIPESYAIMEEMLLESVE